MVSKILFIAFALGAICISSCASTNGFPERPDQPSEALGELRKKFFPPDADVLAAYQASPDATKRSYRDTVVYGRMLAFDLQFSIFQEAIYEEGVNLNLALDIIGLGLGGAGAAVMNAETSRILSALSGGITGSRSSINKNLYYEKTLPALIVLMEAEREKVKAEIIQGLSQEVDKYSLGQALVDLERYFLAGSIPGAVAAVAKTAGQTKKEAEDKLEIERTKAFADPAAQARVDNLLDLADALPVGSAWTILQNPPSNLDSYVSDAVRNRLGGNALGTPAAAARLSGAVNDNNAKQILKEVLVLIEDRSPENLSKWEAALRAAKP